MPVYIRCNSVRRKKGFSVKEKEALNSKMNLAFWFHLLITVLAWIGPFLFSWYLMIAAYGIVMLQFWFFGRCLLNKSHGLEDANDATFYSVLFDLVGIRYDASRLKYWVRNWIYPLLGVITLIIQVGFDWKPILF